MKVAIFGTGYVGLTTGTCLAELGNHVTCVDVDTTKIDMLRCSETPFFEPDLSELVLKNAKAGRLSFTTDDVSPVRQNEVLFIAVGTPSKDSGDVDLSQILDVSAAIGRSLNEYKLIVNKSTVPPGTGEMMADIIREHYRGEFDLIHDLEFLREGTAVSDFMRPDRIVIGYQNQRALETIKTLYNSRQSRFVLTDMRTAEVIKYACNAYLATSISFINSIAEVCENFGADVRQVSEAMRMDKRIGPHAFLDAGIGYGGSCLPKDTRCLIETCKQHGIDHELLSAVENVNLRRVDWIFDRLSGSLGTLKGKSIGIWGLSFKKGSDDMREAPSVVIIKRLQEAGASVKACDPIAEASAKRILRDVVYCDTPIDAATGSDAIVIVTDWDEFKDVDKEELKSVMAGKLVIDGRNVIDMKEMNAGGFEYIGIGR